MSPLCVFTVFLSVVKLSQIRPSVRLATSHLGTGTLRVESGAIGQFNHRLQ